MNTLVVLWKSLIQSLNEWTRTYVFCMKIHYYVSVAASVEFLRNKLVTY